MNNQFKNKNVSNHFKFQDANSKLFLHNKFIDLSTIRNNVHVDFNDKNLDNVHFVKMISLAAVRKQQKAKKIVVEFISTSVVEPILVRINQNNDLKIHFSTNIPKTTLNFESFDDNHATNKSYVDYLPAHDINRPKLSVVRNDQDNDFNDNKLTNINSININKNPTL